MPRQDIERQNLLEPERISYAKNSLIMMGFNVCYEDKTSIEFVYKGNIIKLFPYSGYFNGKGIKAGRGIKDLIQQIKK